MNNELSNRALRFLVSVGIKSKPELKDSIESGILSPVTNKDMGIKLFKELCTYCGLLEVYRDMKKSSFVDESIVIERNVEKYSKYLMEQGYMVVKAAGDQ